MKNYVNDLNEDSLGYICRRISGKQLREIYKKNTKEFQKLKPGFRPGKLSDEDTYAFAIKNRNNSFVNLFLNLWIQEKLDEIDKYKEGLLNTGKTQEAAIVETLTLSIFSDRVDVYFALLDEQPSPEYLTLIDYTISIMQASREAAASQENNNIAREEYEQKLIKLQEEHAVELTALKDAESGMQEALSRTESELAHSRTTNSTLQAELSKYQELSKHAVKGVSIEPAKGYEYVSLCKIYTDEKERSRLLRIADIVNGEISDAFSDYAPHHRNLYRMDGPSKNDFVGIWSWRVRPSVNDPSRDYIESTYSDVIIPIEVVVSNECHNITELISSIKAGISPSGASSRILYAFYNGDTYEGIYCDEGNSMTQSGKLYPQASILKLPVYEFYRSDILQYDSCVLLRFINLEKPSKVVKIKDPLEIVKDLFVSRVTWSVMQQQGYIRNEYQQIKAFLSGLLTTEFYEEITTKCDCGIDEAKQYVDDFLTLSETYVLGNTLENNVMAQIIRNNEALYKDSLEELRIEWEHRNHALVESAQSTISAIKSEEEVHRKAFNQKQEEYHLLEAEITVLQRKKEALEQLAVEVEERVNAKIEHARNNAAEFIAENAFTHLDLCMSAKSDHSAQKRDSDNELFRDGIVKNDEDLEVNKDWKELLSTIQAELLEAGVGNNSVIGLSALLYSAYINCIPILLAGPNGIEIAEAFSMAVQGCTPAVLQCQGNLVQRAVGRCEESEIKTVVIEKPFQPEWYISVIQLLSRRKKFYIAIHPFAEDLSIEPRSLINYCIPVLTDLFVEGLPTMNYLGGHLADNFMPFIGSTIDMRYNKLLRTLSIHSLAKINVQKIVSDIHDMLQSDQTDCDYLFILYPLAYVIGKIDKLKEYIDNASDEGKPSSKVYELIKLFTGED